jgi:hypothetical protein
MVTSMLKHLTVQKQTTLAIPTLLHGSETWTLKENDKYKITAAEIELLRKTAKYKFLDHKRESCCSEQT